MDKIYIKKLVSLHPNKWEVIKLEEAMRRYAVYCFDACNSKFKPAKKVEDLKTFNYWRTTEI